MTSADALAIGPAPAGFERQLPRLLPARGTTYGLGTHLRAYGMPPYRGGPRLLVPMVEAAGLTGRGGASFPTHRKLRAVIAGSRRSLVVAGARRPVVVANGAEGEPASRKDVLLLSVAPHLVLDGLQLAAEAVGAHDGFVYVHRDARLQRRLEVVLAERAAAGVDRVGVRLVDAPPRFLAGEESALVNRMDGGPALPRFTPPRVFERGVGGAPTLVQNVETLAHLALLARYGSDWFRAIGTRQEPGSMLCTLHPADGDPRIVEAAIGTPLHDLLPLADNRTQAVLVGGYHGAWLPAWQAARLSLSNAALRPLGAALGAGVLAALPEGRCGLAETARVVRYLALESAGQCGPCINGLPRIAAALAELAGVRPRPRVRADLARWAGLVERRGACHHPDGTVRFVRSALAVFAEEVDHHERGRCTATVRRPFLPIPAGDPGPDDWG